MEVGQKRSCVRCEHFYMTWDPHFPYGCRALGFKSRSSPMEAVRDASGIRCLYFFPKRREKVEERKR